MFIETPLRHFDCFDIKNLKFTMRLTGVVRQKKILKLFNSGVYLTIVKIIVVDCKTPNEAKCFYMAVLQ